MQGLISKNLDYMMFKVVVCLRKTGPKINWIVQVYRRNYSLKVNFPRALSINIYDPL